MVGETGTNHVRNVKIILKIVAAIKLQDCFCTQDIEVVVPAALPRAVRCQAAVSASVGHLGRKDLEKTAMRQNLMVAVRCQRLSILQPFNHRCGVTWGAMS